MDDLVVTLVSGNHVRVTTYMVEISDSMGGSLSTIDIQDVQNVTRTRQQVTLATKDGRVVLDTVSLEDAGRLEAKIRPLVIGSVEQVPAAGKRSKTVLAGIGCAGLLGVCLLIFVVGAILMDDDDDGPMGNTSDTGAVGEAATPEPPTSDTGAEGEAATPEPPTSDTGAVRDASEPDLPTIGDAVAIPGEGWTLTVSEVRKLTRTDTPFFGSEEALGVYIVVDVTMENTGNRAQSISGRDFTVKDDRGREYSWYSSGSIGYGTKNLGDNINAGLRANGSMLFDVPEDATGLRLEAFRGRYQSLLGDVERFRFE